MSNFKFDPFYIQVLEDWAYVPKPVRPVEVQEYKGYILVCHIRYGKLNNPNEPYVVTEAQTGFLCSGLRKGEFLKDEWVSPSMAFLQAKQNIDKGLMPEAIYKVYIRENLHIPLLIQIGLI